MELQGKTIRVIVTPEDLERMRSIVASCNRMVELSRRFAESESKPEHIAVADDLRAALFGEMDSSWDVDDTTEERTEQVFVLLSGLDEDTASYVTRRSHLDMSCLNQAAAPLTVNFVTDDERLQGSWRFGGVIWVDLKTGLFFIGDDGGEGEEEGWAFAVAIDSNGPTEQQAPIDGPDDDGDAIIHVEYLSERVRQEASQRT